MMKMKNIVYVFMLIFVHQSDGGSCGDKGSFAHPVCSQICQEVKETGTHNCSCKNGYILNSVTGACNVGGEDPVLFYQNHTGLFALNLNTGTRLIVKEGINDILKIEFGPNNTLFWIEDTNPGVYSMKYVPDDFHGLEVLPVIDAGLLSPIGLAVDWISSLLYVIDKGQIIACSIRGENCSVIIPGLDHPQDLTIYRETRMLIWLNKSPRLRSATVNMAKLNGEGHIIFMTGLKSAYSFILDETIGAFFWISSENDEKIIQMMYLKNRQTTTILKLNESETPGLSVLGDSLYVWMEGGIKVLDKFSGQTTRNINVSRIMTARVYHPVIYMSLSSHNPCVHSSCSHLCLPGTDHSNQYSCPCPVHMNHISNTQCRGIQKGSHIIVSGLSGIYQLPVDFIGRSEFVVTELTNQSADCLVYDPISDQLIFYAQQQHSLMSLDLTNPRSSLRTLYNNIWHLEGLAVNERDNILYWTTLEGKVFSVANNLDSEPVMLYDTFKNPRGIVVDSKQRRLYICDWGENPQIYLCDVGGSGCTTLIRVPGGHPNMIVLTAGNQLYWTDSKRDVIGSFNLKNNNTEEITVIYKKNPHPYCIGSTVGRVYYTDLNTGQLHYFEKRNPTALYNLHLNIGALFGLTVVPAESPIVSHDGPIRQYGEEVDTPLTTQASIIIRRPRPTMAKQEVVLMTLPADGFYNLSDTVTRATSHAVHLGQTGNKVGLALLFVFLVIGLSLLGAVVTWFCYWKQRQSKSEWIEKLVRFVKPSPGETDDGEELLPSANLSTTSTFRHFDEVDYPVMSRDKRRFDINMNTRTGSRDSSDSAFTEIHEGPTSVYVIDEAS